MTPYLDFIKFIRSGLGIPILVVSILAMMILPLPPFLLDVLLTFNIAFSLIILLVSVYIVRPLDFSVFPTILLLTTLLRLSLNVASTRVILLNGHNGTHAAGQVIESFGEVVIGGNYAVGLIIFFILLIINFVVVTKGAGRISEVSARFTLDALPGKQMAIDADLNAGLINQDEAKRRRSEVTQESDFYGSMDGASKFVRGDAIAGILILFINILGGVIIGTVQHHMDIVHAMQNYALLTIGDGLVAQIPSILLSTAAAIMVTRLSTAQDMGSEIVKQVASNPKALIITSAIIFSLGLVPGMPHFIFLILSAIPAYIAYTLHQKKRKGENSKESKDSQAKEVVPSHELTWEDIKNVDIICLELGYKLISLVDGKQGGRLLEKVKGVRKNMSQQLGFLIPNIHIRDNLELAPEEYKITILDVNVAQNKVYVEKYLAINPGEVRGKLEGISIKEPAFGLEAFWITSDKREYAQTCGYTVVDASTVIATHLSKELQYDACKLLGFDEVQQLINRLSTQYPKLSESLVPDICPLGTVVKVLQKLLEEHVPIKDFKTIAEALAEIGTKVKDPNQLTEHVRQKLSKLIFQTINGHTKQLEIVTFKPEMEQILQKIFSTTTENQFPLEPQMANNIQVNLKQIVEERNKVGLPSVLVVQPDIRSKISEFFKRFLPGLYVLSYSELPDNVEINVIAAIGS